MELFYTMIAAMGIGALHSLEPGHGKGVMTAYLISSRARLRDAVLLGFTAAAAHTLTIFVLAFVATSALQFGAPETVEAWVGMVSGAIITLIGLKMVYQRLNPPVVSLGSIRSGENVYVCSHGHVHKELAAAREAGGQTGTAHRHSPFRSTHHHHDHPHRHDHHHGHAHAHDIGGSLSLTDPQNRSLRRLITIGILTGLIPCPTALVMLLAAVSEGNISGGIGLVTAFSLGGAIALSTLGILILKAEHKVRKLEQRRFGDLMAGVSACLIVVIGFLVTYESVTKLGLFQ